MKFPALQPSIRIEWVFGPEQAAAVDQPVLSVLGALTQPLWVQVADFLRSSLPRVEDCTIDDVGHLLHRTRRGPTDAAQRRQAAVAAKTAW